ncbi:MAG: SDR family oxidoreductase [Anaerolineales bacterium]|nr:SDR family oxidoreductase [Anaerolineales bacterium]
MTSVDNRPLRVFLCHSSNDKSAVDTPMLCAGLSRAHVGGTSIDERLEDLARKIVSGKVGHPEEIAHAIYLLADDEQASFKTGQAMVVDGGATARLSTE